MRDDRHKLESLDGRMIVADGDIVDHVLQDEEEQGEDHPDFGSGEENLDEEALNDEENVEEDEHHEGDVEGNLAESHHQNATLDCVYDQVDDEKSEEPCRVVDPQLHPHDRHAFPDFFLLLGQHLRGLPEINDHQRQHQQELQSFFQVLINRIIFVVLLVDGQQTGVHGGIGGARFDFRNDRVHRVNSCGHFGSIGFAVARPVEIPVGGQGSVGVGSVGQVPDHRNVEPDIVFVVRSLFGKCYTEAKVGKFLAPVFLAPDDFVDFLVRIVERRVDSDA